MMRLGWLKAVEDGLATINKKNFGDATTVEQVLHECLQTLPRFSAAIDLVASTY